jgi:hypothetical protein
MTNEMLSLPLRKLNYRRILAWGGGLSLLAYFVFAWTSMWADHYQRTGSDFMGFYNFGRIYETKDIQSIYEIKEQERIEEEVVGHPVTVIFYTHLPFIAPLAQLIVNENYLESFTRWAIILLLLNVVNVYLLVRTLEIKKFTKENLFILCMGAFLFDPTFSGLMNGQDIALLLLGVILWVRGLYSKDYFWAGIGLSLTTIRPQIALLLAIPFFFRHRKVFWGFALGSLVLAGISFWLLKFDGALKFIESIQYIEGTIWREPHAFDMPTISGILRRNFEITDPALAKNFVWIIYILGIAGFSFWWHRSEEITERHIGLITLAAIFLLPYAHYHELTLLLIPIFCLIRMLQKSDAVQQYYLAVLPLIVSWLSALGFIGSGSMKFPIIYSVMIVLAYMLVTRGRVLQTNPQLAVEGQG